MALWIRLVPDDYYLFIKDRWNVVLHDDREDVPDHLLAGGYESNSIIPILAMWYFGVW